LIIPAIIICIAIAGYFLFRKKRIKKNIHLSPIRAKASSPKASVNIEKDEVYIDENGNSFRWIEKSKEIPRKTFVYATLHGKYWGELNEGFSDRFTKSTFYDFNIYEAVLENARYSRDIPFVLEQDHKMPRERLPKLLPTTLQEDEEMYEVNLHEPIFANIRFDRKLHQDEGDEVFGTIHADVTGYILDFKTTPYLEKQYIRNDASPKITQTNSINNNAALTHTKTPTGNVEFKGNYQRTEYFYSDYRTAYWSNWHYRKTSNYSGSEEGCLSVAGGLMMIIVSVIFMLNILPWLPVIIPFIVIPLILRLIPTGLYSRILGLLGILLLIGFVISLPNKMSQSANHKKARKHITYYDPEERKVRSIPIKVTMNKVPVKDSLIQHVRSWQDYEGNKYNGTIWTRNSDFRNARQFKNNLDLYFGNATSYDQVIYRLKEHDKEHLNGIYQLFDDIRNRRQLSDLQFAEVIVSFVQDIPYAIILPDDCDPSLYRDPFTSNYLLSKNARCDGFQKFGINTPVEFMSTLNGDCDSRTLLLYTILSHYNYDVAILSSEIYNHSLLGINLPYNGTQVNYQNRRYVLWETTSAGLKAGLIPGNISNLNYWRVSLKSN